MKLRKVPLRAEQTIPSKKQNLGLLDTTFLHIETRDTPMHVAALLIYQLPDDTPENFIQQIVSPLRDKHKAIQAPWNLKLANSTFASLVPKMETAKQVDLSYHVRHSALPLPGGERELGELVSRLHGQLLDRSAPLWTCNVIEGLSEGRFALYIKMHHALTDGINGIRMATRCLANIAEGEWSSPWHYQKPVTKKTESRSKQRFGQGLNLEGLALKSWPSIFSEAVRPYLRQSRDSEPVRIPFEAPSCSLNGPVTSARRVATQQLDMASVKALAKKSDSSVNDIFLAVCSTALQRHLRAIGDLPETPLVAGVPISLREPGEEGGNAIGFLWASLATNLNKPKDRLAAIKASMAATKTHLFGLPKALRSAYTMATMAPSIGVLLSGMGARTKPPMNVTISNVPGPDKKLYMEGAELTALYPISIPFQGLALNITCISYAGKLNIGFTGSRDSLPSLQRLSEYANEAMSELELAFNEETR